MAKLPLNPIQNNEEGLSVREKLNVLIDRANATENIEGIVDNHSSDTSNPHKVKAPQVQLEPILTPLAANEQNVQAALEWLYAHFVQSGGEGWHLDEIDGIYTVIQINRGPNTQFPPEPADLRVGELKLDWNEGKLWTKLGDDADVIIGGKGVIFEAPLDGELYGRKVSETDPTVGDWYRISLATVSDDMPQNPSEGDLWVDTKNTLELYVYVDDNGWVSMTGAGSGGGEIPDNITTDDIDGTLVNKLLGREMDEDGAKIWRPIYTSDVMTEGAQPMFRSTETGRFTKATDPAAIRDQQTANWFLYETMQEMDGNYVPVTGGEFTGPIFGPSVTNVNEKRTDTLTVNLMTHQDPTCPEGELLVQTQLAGDRAVNGAQQRVKLRVDNASQYCDEEDIEYVLAQGPLIQVLVCENSGFATDNNSVLNVVAEETYGDDLLRNVPTTLWRSSLNASPYVTLDMFQKLLPLIGGSSVTIDTQAPANPSDGDLWFDNREEVMQLFVWHEDSDAWIPVAPPATLESRVRQGELTQEAIIAQIQESLEEQARIRDSLDSASSDLDGKVSLSGTNNLDHTTRWRLKQRDADGGADNTYLSIHDGDMGLYNVAYPTNVNHAATMGYVDDRVDPVWEQLRQTTVINEEHSFKFTVFNTNPRPGEFNLQDTFRNITADPDQAQYIALSTYDFAGEQWNYDKPNEGDTIRFEHNGRYLIFNIIDGAQGFYAIEKVEGTILNLETSPVYDFNFFIDIDPNEIAYKGYVDAAIANNRGDIDVNQYPTVDYVEERLDEKLNKSGGTMTGDLSLKRTDDSYWTYIRSQKPDAWNTSQETHGLIIDIGDTNSYKHQFKIIGRSGKDLLEMHDDGKAQARLLGNLDVANTLKQGGYPVATQVYVQSALSGLEIPEAVATERPMLWKYNPNVAANNLGNGEFNLSSSPTNGAASEWSIYFAKRDANGQYWYPHDSGNAFTHSISEQMATIRGREQVCVHGKTQQWLFNQGSNKYAQLKLTYYRSSNAMASGKYYLITIPGYMPYFTFSTDAQTNGTH